MIFLFVVLREKCGGGMSWVIWYVPEEIKGSKKDSEVESNPNLNFWVLCVQNVEFEIQIEKIFTPAPRNMLVWRNVLLVVKTNELNYLKFNNIKLLCSCCCFGDWNFPSIFQIVWKLLFPHRAIFSLFLIRRRFSDEENFEFYSDEKVSWQKKLSPLFSITC